MARALYRQYRSKSFDEVIGQEHITDLLKESISRDSFSHAYLFTGPRGTGKTSVARILAHEINKLPYSEDINLDIIEIDAASNRRIDDIRDLREKVHIAPSLSRYKVYIIDEVHMLTGESFNALLKTIEEPPAHAIFILATTELHKVPATIVSRTQRFQFRPVSKEKVVAHLKSIAGKESITIDDEALGLIADHGGGSFRDSISLLDQIASGEPAPIDAKKVELLLGIAPIDTLTSLLTSIKNTDQSAAVDTLKSLYDDGHSALSIIEQLLRLIPIEAGNDSKLYSLLDSLVDVPRSYSPQLKLLSVIALAAQPHKQHKTIALSVEAPRVISMPIKQKPAAQPTVTIATQTAKSEPIQDTPKKENISHAPSQSGEFDWNHILEILQKRYAPLHSVLKRAQITHESDVLTLAFAYNLHRKKMEDAKYRGILTSLIDDQYGHCPELKVILSNGPVIPTDPTAASVAAIMGGGEQVNA